MRAALAAGAALDPGLRVVVLRVALRVGVVLAMAAVARRARARVVLAAAATAARGLGLGLRLLLGLRRLLLRLARAAAASTAAAVALARRREVLDRSARQARDRADRPARRVDRDCDDLTERGPDAHRPLGGRGGEREGDDARRGKRDQRGGVRKPPPCHPSDLSPPREPPVTENALQGHEAPDLPIRPGTLLKAIFVCNWEPFALQARLGGVRRQNRRLLLPSSHPRYAWGRVRARPRARGVM